MLWKKQAAMPKKSWLIAEGQGYMSGGAGWLIRCWGRDKQEELRKRTPYRLVISGFPVEPSLWWQNMAMTMLDFLKDFWSQLRSLRNLMADSTNSLLKRMRFAAGRR